jgi:Tfp pilus assembly protein PilV
VIEVIIATAILVIGVSAMAALGAVMLTRGRQSRYINVAQTLVSEKLEDLNRWNMASPYICVQAGDTSEGSLNPTTLVTQTITCPGTSLAQSVSYYDDISIDFLSGTDCTSVNNGCFAETVYNGSTLQYQTTYHSPDGVIPGTATGIPVTSSTAPSNMTFHRTWLIEANTPEIGTRRITVLVTLLDQSVKPSVSFQMSLVRQ